MTAPISKLQRWLDLIAFLVGRHLPVAVEAIMEGVPAYATKWGDADETSRASTRRMFERDKDELRKLGIPIETVSYRVNYGVEQVEGYCIRRRDFYLPYLRLVKKSGRSAPASARPYPLPEIELTEAEAEDALGALREVAQIASFPLGKEARSAFRKLAFDLDPDELQSTPVIFVDRPGAGELRQRVRPLSDALLARKTIQFRYQGIHRGEATDRAVYPYGLFFQHGNWYLVGHDLGRNAIRVFRVGRMEQIEANAKSPNTPDYDIPKDFRLENYLQRQAWELGDEAPVQVQVLFRFPTSLWADRNRYGVLVEERSDGSVVRSFQIQQVNPFLRWLLTLGNEVEILTPVELATELREMARAVTSLYKEAI